jgi:Poly(ADP-ribose) polymerase catalytic domain
MVKLPRRDSLPDDSLRLKEHFNAQHPELFNLPRTVLNNPPGLLFKVRDEVFMERLKRGYVLHAFLFLPHDQGRLEAFRALASSRMYHRAFAFHGSPMCNWQSILRRGLLVASGTAYQQYLAKHGPGIYLTNNLYRASLFSRNVESEAMPFSGTEWRCCIVVCDVLYHQTECVTSHQIFVVGDARRVVVRALLVSNSAFVDLDANELGGLLTALPSYRELHGLGAIKT